MGEPIMNSELLSKRYNLLAVAGAFLFGVFMMVDDELFTYMSMGLPKYEFPVIGYFALWDAWALDFGFIVLSVGLMLYGIYKSRQGESESRHFGANSERAQLPAAFLTS